MTNRDQYEDSSRAARRTRATQRAQSTYQGQRVSREARQVRSHAAYQNQDRATYSRDNYSRAQQGEGTPRTRTQVNAGSQYSRANYGVQRNQSGHYGRDQYSRNVPQRKKGSILPKLAVVVALIAVIGGGVFAYNNFGPIKVTINGTEYELQDKTVQGALEVSKVAVTPGNFVAVDNSVIEQGKGTAFTATVDGHQTTDGTYKVKRNAVIEITNGTDITEEYTSNDEVIPATVEMTGTGAIHKFEGDGTPGVRSTMTGKTSGKTVTQVTREPSNIASRAYNADTNGEKVIALTIDDGPWPSSTKEILDILEQNNAVATFFVVGNCVEQQTEGANLIKREKKLGCQVCTHTYDHAEGSGQGVNITYMSDSEQVQEIEKGRKVISDVLGEEASHVVRLPGGNLNANTVNNLHPYVTAEIGWNLDTEDWRRPGADAIYNVFMQSYPGAIILCHDGGGDRSQTVEALRRAIPDLKARGYKFITMDEMLKYPAQPAS